MSKQQFWACCTAEWPGPHASYCTYDFRSGYAQGIADAAAPSVEGERERALRERKQFAVDVAEELIAWLRNNELLLGFDDSAHNAALDRAEAYALTSHG